MGFLGYWDTAAPVSISTKTLEVTFISSVGPSVAGEETVSLIFPDVH